MENGTAKHADGGWSNGNPQERREDMMRAWWKWNAPAGATLLAALVAGPITAANASAPLGRYTVSTDTVVDTVTGLTWQRAPAPSTYTWDAAKTYCASLSLGGIALGGWRLPRRLELESTVDFGATKPSIDIVAFPNTPAAKFWSSSPAIDNSTVAWLVSFSDGNSTRTLTSDGISVRCVH